MRSKQTTINAHKKGGELSRMYNELVAQFFWPESLLLLHEKTCGHRMLFSKRLSVGKRITRGFFPCISFFFSFSCAVLGCRHRKAHYRFISEIIIDFFSRTHVNGKSAIWMNSIPLPHQNTCSPEIIIVEMDGVEKNWHSLLLSVRWWCFIFWCNLALWAWLMNVNLWPNFHSNGGSFFLYAVSHSGF